MKTIMYFVAEDGTVFNDKEKCIEYETIQDNLIKEELLFYNSSRKPMSLNENFDGVFFVLVKSLRAAQWLMKLCDDRMYESPFECRGVKPGLYWWDSEYDGWRCWEEETDKLEEFARYFQLFE